VEGKVKWFSVEKGYGFITGTDGSDRYFSVQDVVGAELPGNGDSVTFEHRRGKKGPRAAGITIVAKAAPPANQRQDDRVTCEHCNRKDGAAHHYRSWLFEPFSLSILWEHIRGFQQQRLLYRYRSLWRSRLATGHRSAPLPGQSSQIALLRARLHQVVLCRIATPCQDDFAHAISPPAHQAISRCFCAPMGERVNTIQKSGIYHGANTRNMGRFGCFYHHL